MPTPKLHEIRCPVHGFVILNDWEREIVSHPVFQRLRRIRQLAWTEYVYPGATHTRFEHSLGVMHIATKLYEAVVERQRAVLVSELSFNDDGLGRDKQLVRLAALLHDVGHTPFSHAAEELMPDDPNGKKYEHERYSASLIRHRLRDVIENHPMSRNYGFKADDVAALIEGSATAKQSLFWREIVSGQMDADRMDYLLRDSLHCGVGYGRFDLHRLVSTVDVAVQADAGSPRLGISEGGWHAAESLVLARYLMFTQVYFHKTRVAYDAHLKGALAEMLPDRRFPSPEASDLDEFLRWDDWRVLGLLGGGQGGEHGERLRNRNHYRQVFHTPESPTIADLEYLKKVRSALGDLVVLEQHAAKSWYKTGATDIPVVSDTRDRSVKPLSQHSAVVQGLPSSNQVLLYSTPEQAETARAKAEDISRRIRASARRSRPVPSKAKSARSSRISRSRRGGKI